MIIWKLTNLAEAFVGQIGITELNTSRIYTKCCVNTPVVGNAEEKSITANTREYNERKQET